MRRHLFAVALAVMPLASCATLALPPAPIVSTAGTTQDEKRLYDAELAYNVAGNAYLTAVARGQLTGERKAAAKDALQKALAALRVLRQGVRTLNASDFNSQLASASALIASASALIRG